MTDNSGSDPVWDKMNNRFYSHHNHRYKCSYRKNNRFHLRQDSSRVDTDSSKCRRSHWWYNRHSLRDLTCWYRLGKHRYNMRCIGHHKMHNHLALHARPRDREKHIYTDNAPGNSIWKCIYHRGRNIHQKFLAWDNCPLCDIVCCHIGQQPLYIMVRHD